VDIEERTVFDHISCDKYWLVSEPYIDEESLLRDETIQYALSNGLKVYGIEKPGYHFDGVTTLIFVPRDREKFVKAVNRVLDKYSRDELWSRFFADKAGVRRIIRHYYDPPPAGECLMRALDYLTWRDERGQKYLVRHYPHLSF